MKSKFDDRAQGVFRNKRACSILMGLTMLIGTNIASAQGTGPQISLFPKAVTAELAITRETSREMENGLRDIVKRMTRQKELFAQSSCEGDASNSTGCGDILEQLSTTYVAMLDKMAESLPELKRSVQNTEKMLQKRIAKELGHNKTPHQLQKDLQNDGRDVRRPSRGPTTSGHSMSARLERQFKLISQNQNQSVMSLASEIYLDMREASGWIEQIEAQVIRQKQIAELTTGSLSYTPEMDNTISQVSTLLLGEGESGLFIEPPSSTSAAPPSSSDEGFTMN